MTLNLPKKRWRLFLRNPNVIKQDGIGWVVITTTEIGQLYLTMNNIGSWQLACRISTTTSKRNVSVTCSRDYICLESNLYLPAPFSSREDLSGTPKHSEEPTSTTYLMVTYSTVSPSSLRTGLSMNTICPWPCSFARLMGSENVCTEPVHTHETLIAT